MLPVIQSWMLQTKWYVPDWVFDPVVACHVCAEGWTPYPTPSRWPASSTCVGLSSRLPEGDVPGSPMNSAAVSPGSVQPGGGGFGGVSKPVGIPENPGGFGAQSYPKDGGNWCSSGVIPSEWPAFGSAQMYVMVSPWAMDSGLLGSIS